MLQDTVKTKRKVPDDETGSETMTATTTTNNPLVNAAKKAKREVCLRGFGKDRRVEQAKLANAEEQPGGLLIVRAPSVPTSAPTPTTTATTTTTTSTKPPSKKFKSSNPSPSPHPHPIRIHNHSPNIQTPSKSPFLPSSQPLTHTRHDTPDADPALDDAVRAMQDEAAHLRRASRGPMHVHDPTTTTSPSAGLMNPTFRFPSTAGVTGDGTGKGGGKGKAKRRETIVDTSRPLPPEGDETPLIARNKRLRAGAMAAIGSGTQPHPTVADTSFYKHIDADLPDAERVRQLLIWCSARAASSPTSSSSSSSAPPSSSKASSSSPALPVLSSKAAQALKATCEDVVRKLAERRVDLSLYAEEAGAGQGRENKQGRRRRMRRM
ncbi:putative mis12-Mtw1 protein family protein [Lyophyllum shimeji]|uniref:Mis12-Mtw1 protein family protein n=1 Tax=Lyophyllum shimeji TaxID=47721 RepID=A0A9P3UQ03_LYOSH|nr:putative mis12-Mtw1 protein family protein [Lyophyllum shimeji]